MNFGELLRLLKNYVVYDKYSDEQLLNDMLECFILSASVKAKDSNEPLYFDKSYTSRIKNNSVGIPSHIVKAVKKYRTVSTCYDRFSDFCKEHINQNLFAEFREKTVNIISKDITIPEEEKHRLSSTFDNNKYLYTLLVMALLIDNNSSVNTDTIIWKRGNSYVRLVVGDIFKYAFSDRRKRKNIIVIPVNTRYDTHLSTKLEKTPNPMISRETIHGEWLLRVEKRGENTSIIQKRIQEDLKLHKFVCNEQGEYPIGSIATIDYGNVCFYLLAISSFDKNNHATSCLEYVKEAIDSLLNYYDLNGQGYELYIPLLGTGRSRAGLSFQESFDLIRQKAIDKASSIHGKINIVIERDVNNTIISGGKEI